jgi:hypothetical protein
MVSSATNIYKTITSHLKSLNIHKTTTYDIGNPGPGLRQAYNVVELNRLMGSKLM